MLEKVTQWFRGSKQDSILPKKKIDKSNSFEQDEAGCMTSVIVPEVALPKGYYLTSSKTYYSMVAINANPSIKKVLQHAAPNDVLVEFRGKLLKYTDANALIAQLMLQHKSLKEISDILESTPSILSNEDATTYTH